ncbi:MAG: class II aldolase/adducin family protein [Deltaproteobacteria bacterium]|nr:class II aldolase/adducin family protein [Deltaproteobacteria bacterium]
MSKGETPIAEAPEGILKTKLALACRILGTEGQDDLDLGHVSVRIPGHPERMWMKGKGLCLSEIHAEDLVTLDFNYRKLAGARAVHGELPIHVEIYRTRPDVNCVIHTHPLYATAFAATRQPLPAVNNEAVLFAAPLPYFDASTDLIVKPEQGRLLAETLGDAKAVFMKNHGIVVVGESIEQAVARAYLLEKTIKTLFIAKAFGEPAGTDAAEAALKEDHIFGGDRIQSIWETLVRMLEQREKPLRLLEELLRKG